MSRRRSASVALTLLVGSPALTLIGAIGAALTAALPRGGLLAAVLVLPLTIPVLIFGVLATAGAIADPAPFLSPFLLLCAGDARGAGARADRRRGGAAAGARLGPVTKSLCVATTTHDR